MKKFLRINNHEFSLCHQGLLSQFYFKVDYDKDYILHRLFQCSFKSGVTTQINVQIYDKWYEYTWIERRTVGLFFDITVLNIRLGIYLHPIIYKTIK